MSSEFGLNIGGVFIDLHSEDSEEQEQVLWDKSAILINDTG